MEQWRTAGIEIPKIIRESLERLALGKWNPRLQTEYRLQAKDREEFATLFAVERKEGRQEKAIEIAQKMLRRGRPLDEIMEDTGLTPEDIEALREGREIDDRPGTAADSTASGGGAGSRGHE
jgi:hypothetical protein